MSGKRKLAKAAEVGIRLKQTGKNRGAFDPLDYVSDDLAGIIDGYREPDERTVMQNNDGGKLRQMMEYCAGRGKTTLNPIIDWSDADIWEYIEQENLPYCKLYAHGGGIIHGLAASAALCRAGERCKPICRRTRNTRRRTCERLTGCSRHGVPLTSRAPNGTTLMRSCAGGSTPRNN